jgi:hypothetical protein
MQERKLLNSENGSPSLDVFEVERGISVMMHRTAITMPYFIPQKY